MVLCIFWDLLQILAKVLIFLCFIFEFFVVGDSKIHFKSTELQYSCFEESKYHPIQTDHLYFNFIMKKKRVM